jgi:deoxycytidine triphosphate deaminase
LPRTREANQKRQSSRGQWSVDYSGARYSADGKVRRSFRNATVGAVVYLPTALQPTFFDVAAKVADHAAEARASKKYFVPFGSPFVLHPGRFVLASTLEWLKFPSDLAGYVGGKSTWARRGLIIETAAGIHPGFGGCLTLELANVGEVPIIIRPGMVICQVFVHKIDAGEVSSTGNLLGRRRPFLGSPKDDPILDRLGPPTPST